MMIRLAVTTSLLILIVVNATTTTPPPKSTDNLVENAVHDVEQAMEAYFHNHLDEAHSELNKGDTEVRDVLNSIERALEDPTISPTKQASLRAEAARVKKIQTEAKKDLEQLKPPTSAAPAIGPMQLGEMSAKMTSIKDDITALGAESGEIALHDAQDTAKKIESEMASLEKAMAVAPPALKPKLQKELHELKAAQKEVDTVKDQAIRKQAAVKVEQQNAPHTEADLMDVDLDTKVTNNNNVAMTSQPPASRVAVPAKTAAATAAADATKAAAQGVAKHAAADTEKKNNSNDKEKKKDDEGCPAAGLCPNVGKQTVKNTEKEMKNTKATLAKVEGRLVKANSTGEADAARDELLDVLKELRKEQAELQAEKKTTTLAENLASINADLATLQADIDETEAALKQTHKVNSTGASAVDAATQQGLDRLQAELDSFDRALAPNTK